MSTRLKPGDVGRCFPKRHAIRMLERRGVMYAADLSMDSLARLVSHHELLSVAVRSNSNEPFEISGAWLEGEPVRSEQAA